MTLIGNSHTKIADPDNYLIEIELLHDSYELVRQRLEAEEEDEARRHGENYQDLIVFD